MNLERNAVQAIHDAIRNQSDDIERQTVNAFAVPLQQMKNGAGYLRNYMREMKWLTISLLFVVGLALGFWLGYWPMRSSLNTMQEQLDRIEQSQSAQQKATPAPDSHVPDRKGKTK